LKSTYKGDSQVNFSSLVVDEITLIGSRCGPFETALQLMVEGKVNPRPLLEACYSLERGLEAFEQAAQPGVLKVLIHP
jgi:threonine dehydrogenase-like Zn-dependent dehydrogenase